MPCFTYASVCNVCTTSLRGKPRGTYETTMVLDYSGGTYRNSTISLHRRTSRHASVELAAAAAVRLESAHVLAGACTLGIMPDSLWRTRSSWRTWTETSLGGPLQTNDAGRAREIPPGA